MEINDKIREVILQQNTWRSEDLIKTIELIEEPVVITFCHIGGYELLRDGTREEEIRTYAELKEFCDENELTYDKKINDMVELAEYIESEWEERYEDGGGLSWIEW